MTAEVKVKITADGSQVGTAVGKVKKDLAGVKDAGEVLSGAMVKVGGVIAGAFAVSSVTGFLRTVNSATDNLNDLSTRLGASASGLQVLQIAAQQAGGSAEGMGSMKSQFKKADASGARFALIFGPDEVAQGQVSVKPLRAVEGQVAAQRAEPLADAAQWAASLR